MARRTVVLTLALLVSFAAGRSTSADNPVALTIPTAHELLERVVSLTTPEMAGRASGTPGGEHAAQRIAEWLAEAGLKPGGDAGTFFQRFSIASARRLGAGTTLEVPAVPTALVAPRDWTPHGGSPNGDATGEVLFAGHGVSDPGEGYDDYAGIDARGKVVLVLAGAPAHLRSPPASRLEKLIAARAHGAAALLIADDALPSLDTTDTPMALISGHVTTAAADTLLAPATTSAEVRRATSAEVRRATTVAARRAAIATARRPASAATGVTARIRVALETEERRAANVIGIVPGGDPVRSREAVVIGAHYDHLGVVHGQVHPGADDNASGTAVVVGLARAFADVAAARPAARSLVFVLFSGEEIGLLGSEHYVRQPARPIADTIAMLNFDQVGRMRAQRLDIGGVDSATGLRRLVDEVTGPTGARVSQRGTPWAPSDHISFYAARVPVLFFHTGTHPDYHAPTDTADRLDAEGMATVARLGAQIVARLADGPSGLMYAEVPRERPAARRAREGGAFLGVAGGGHGGELRLTGIVDGSAADRAGIRRGDVIVRMAGASIESFDALRAALRAYRAGDTVPLVYVRNGERHDTAATLGER